MSRRGARVDYSGIDEFESDSSEEEPSRPAKIVRKNDAPAKRGRGRPPKSAADGDKNVYDDSTLEADAATVAKKARDRQKKATSEKTAQDEVRLNPPDDESGHSTLETATSDPPKKRRGRPKANAAASEETGDDSRLEAADTEDKRQESHAKHTEPAAARGRPGRKPKAATAEHHEPPASQETAGRRVRIREPEESELADRSRGHRKKTREAAVEAGADSTVDESMEEHPAETEDAAADGMDVTEDGAERATSNRSPRTAAKRGRKATKTKQSDSSDGGSTAKRKRDESPEEAEDIEDASDDTPALRRKLDHTKKDLEMLQTRYKKLKEVGIKEADAKFDLLKDEMMSREKTQQKAADDVIAALKADLAAAKREVSEVAKLQTKLAKAEEKWRDSQKGVEKLKDKVAAAEADNKAIRAKVDSAEAENKTMRTKLAAARKAAVEAPAANGRGVESTSKGKGKAIADPRAAAQAAIATLKEDLYGDLTGLIIRDVDQAEEGDVFDCIQTGRNGTLHFLLAIDKTDPAASYEETKFHYKPLIDEQRDRDLLEIIPEYLGEEIEFPRAKAAGFFSRIWDPLTRKLQ